MFWWVLSVMTIIVLYVRLYKPHFYWKERNAKYITPGPIVGNFGSFVLNKASFSDMIVNLYNTFDERYFGIYQFLTPCLLLKDIEIIRQIGVKDFDSFVDHRSSINQDTDPLIGRNLINLKGKLVKLHQHMILTLQLQQNVEKITKVINCLHILRTDACFSL